METDHLSATLAALADPTRRAILARLAAGEATVTELAAPFAMTLPAVSRHLKVLESAGLITRGREAQFRPCRLEAEPLREVADWVEQYRRFWDERLDRLEEYLRNLQTKEEQSSMDDRTIMNTRIIDAPRELVFKAWTDPKHLANWWGPNGYTTTTHEMDFRPGGVWRFVMHGPDGVDYPNKIAYTEVVAPERIEYLHSDDEEGGQAPFHVVATFAEEGGKTRLTMRLLFPSAAERDRVVREFGAGEGLNQTLGRLVEYVAKL